MADFIDDKAEVSDSDGESESGVNDGEPLKKKTKLAVSSSDEEDEEEDDGLFFPPYLGYSTFLSWLNQS